VILIDYEPHAARCPNDLRPLDFGISQNIVDTTIANGRVLMENKKLTLDIDEAAVAAKAGNWRRSCGIDSRNPLPGDKAKGGPARISLCMLESSLWKRCNSESRPREGGPRPTPPRAIALAVLAMMIGLGLKVPLRRSAGREFILVDSRGRECGRLACGSHGGSLDLNSVHAKHPSKRVPGRLSR